MAMIYLLKQKKLRNRIACSSNSGKSFGFYFLEKIQHASEKKNLNQYEERSLP